MGAPKGSQKRRQREEALRQWVEELNATDSSRQEVLDALEEREELARAILDSVKVGVLMVDPDDHQIEDANTCALEMLGASREQVVGRVCHEFVCPNAQGQCPITDRGQPVDNAERVLITLTGEKIPVIKSVVPVSVEGRTHLVESFVDIRVQKRAEEGLRRANQHWIDTFNTINDAITIHDRQFRILRANRAAEELSGLPLKEILESRCFEVYHGSNRPPRSCPSCECLTSGAAGSFEMFEPHLRKHLEVKALPQRDEEGSVQGVVHVVRDITDRKRMEQQAMQSQKMEALGRLAGGLAHDLNNLMTAVIGFSDLALSSMPEKDPLREDVREIRKAGEKAADLIRQVLAFSRRQVLEPKVLALNEIVTDTRKMLRRLIGENIQLLTELARDLGPVKVDPGQLGQVLVNLAVNARDAMPSGGRLAVTTRNVFLAPKDLEERGVDLAPGPYVRLSVADTGTGMDQATLDRIFDPFFTTKEAGKGTGLGLATVHGIVKQSGGDIVVRSVPGKGSRFDVFLPIANEALHRPAPQEIRPVNLGEGKGNVLVVEDEEVVLRLARQILRGAGYTVFCAKDGDEALGICGESRVDLVISDIVMPGMSGVELIEGVKSRHPSVRVIYMSGHGDSVLTQLGVPSSPEGVLRKPFTPEELTRKVREALDP